MALSSLDILDAEVIHNSWRGYASDLVGYEDIEGRFGGEPDGGVITGCAED